MKERNNGLTLTLENLNCEEARDSPYVLTSPRSLQACKIVEVKPLELLYRSVDEIRQQLNPSTTLDHVLTVHKQQETIRKNKLEVCRKVRDQLISYTTTTPSTVKYSKENVNPRIQENLIDDREEKRDISPKRNFSPKRTYSPVGVLKNSLSPVNTKRRTPSPSVSFKDTLFVDISNKTQTSDENFINRKELLDKQNQAKREDVTLKSVENHLNDTYTKSVLHIDTSPVRTTPTNNLLRQQLPTVFSPLNTSTSKTKSRTRKYTKNTKGNLRGVRLTPDIKLNNRNNGSSVLPNVNVSRPSSSSYSATTSTTFSRPSSSIVSSTRIYSGNSTRIIRSANSSRSSSDNRPSRSRICTKWSLVDSVENTSMNKRINSARQQLYSWLSDSMSVPEHDRRILESMAMKKEEELNAEERAYKAHLAWEMDRNLREKENNLKTLHRMKEISEKRRLENLESERKMAEIRTREAMFQQKLQQNLLDKEVRSAAIIKSITDRKSGEQGSRAEEIERQRASVLWAKDQIEQEKFHLRSTLQQDLNDRLLRAELTRNHFTESIRRRVASANRVEEVRHNERKRQLEAETEERMRVLRIQCQEKEDRARDLIKKSTVEKEKLIRCQSEARVTRYQQARQMHAELEAGLERWREQCASLQRDSAKKAERRALQQQKEKQHKAEIANRTREDHHNLIMTRVSAEQNAVEEARRSAILAKENKMRRLQIKRDQAVCESRSQAHTTAQLRDQIRHTVSPDTFDRMVTRSALEARVTASRINTSQVSINSTRSHIILG